MDIDAVKEMSPKDVTSRTVNPLGVGKLAFTGSHLRPVLEAFSTGEALRSLGNCLFSEFSLMIESVWKKTSS